jgi:NAD(P)H-dependent FMN reductase
MQTNTVKILSISGSLRPNSSNHSILQFIAANAPEGIDFATYEGIDLLPHFNPALDTEEAPEQVAGLRAAIAEAKGVIVCTPEYAFGVPGSLKNALDWTVSSGSFNTKPVAIITASSSGEKAHAALLNIFTALGAKVNQDATLLISYIRTKVNAAGTVTDETTRNRLMNVLEALLKEITDSSIDMC